MGERRGLRQKAATGMMWTALQKYTIFFLNFVADIILARLLSPSDFGCIEMLAVFMLVAEAFIGGGFGSALIQKKRPTQIDYSTVFYWNIGMAIIMYAVLFTFAPAISKFYGIPILSEILRIQGLILFVYAFNIIQFNQLKKKLNFKAIAIVTVITQMSSFVVTIVLAYRGFGVWSLVAKNLIASTLTSIIFWFYLKWRPLFVFSWQSFKELFSFGFYMFLTHFVTQISVKIQSLLIGKIYNPSTIGYYAKASSTEHMASSCISQVMEQVTFPLYAEVQDNKIALQNMVKKLTMTLAYVTFPLLFILLLLAKPIFILLYTEKWLQSVPYFQVLCIAGLAHCLQSVNMQTISAIGKSKVTFVWTMVKRFVGIGFIVLGLVLYGMKGLLCGAVLNQWFTYFVNMGLVSKHVGYKWTRQLLDLSPVFFASIVVAVISFFCGQLCNYNIYYNGAIVLLAYLILYLGWSFVFKPTAFEYFKTIIIPAVTKFRNKLR